MPTYRDFELLNSGMDSLTGTLLRKDVLRQQREERDAAQRTADERTALDRDALGLRREALGLDREQLKQSSDAKNELLKHTQVQQGIKALNDQTEQILGMVDAGNLTPEQGQAQLQALHDQIQQSTQAVVGASRLGALVQNGKVMPFTGARATHTPALTADERRQLKEDEINAEVAGAVKRKEAERTLGQLDANTAKLQDQKAKLKAAAAPDTSLNPFRKIAARGASLLGINTDVGVARPPKGQEGVKSDDVRATRMERAMLEKEISRLSGEAPAATPSSAKPEPLPRDRKAWVVGKPYINAAGKVAVWDGKQFVAVQ